MKKTITIALLCSFALTASADELADGLKAWEKRDFAQAQQIYTRLANDGNAQAQLLLGELYGFGEGVPEDLPMAEKWLAKAQSAGNPDAAASLASVRQRAARKADIARYASGFDGADLRLEKFGCTRPVYPDVSRSQAQIREVEAGTKTWRACYDRFAAFLAAQMPAGKAIPEDLASLMNLSELDRARNSMDQAYARATAAASTEGKAILADYDGWYARTQKLGLAMEKKTRDESSMRQTEIDRTNERMRAALEALKTGL
jgi:TPR repeat protein